MEVDRRAVISAMAGLSLLSGARAAGSQMSDIVETSSGFLRGRSQDGVTSFLGVRYGEDTRASRFGLPVAARRRPGIQEATTFGAACPQSSSEPNQSEDCLFLNIWTPSPGNRAARPVMVYFHGGAYSNGSGSDALYDGAKLAAKGDVVVVTVNHRLNAFGYLYLDQLFPGQFPFSGNAGQWDLVLALKWVKRNAQAFGGDPDRVMVFGQSGGGAKIATLMASPSAQGLFHSAATMSGQQVTASGPFNATLRARAFLDALGLPADVAALKAMPAERIVGALSARDPVNPAFGLYFGPVLDERMLKRHPFFPDAPAQSAHIPMILGNTRDETRAFLGTRPEAFSLSWDDVPGWLEAQMRCDILPGEVVRVYRQTYPHMSPSDVMFAATTAGRSWRGQVEQADARARQGAPTWVYRFDLASPQEGGRRGAAHMIDIAHAFDNLDRPGAFSGIGEAARRVADELSNAFIQLARTGDPNHARLPAWERYSVPERRTMVFDAITRQEDDPRKVERELFAKVPFIQWGS